MKALVYSGPFDVSVEDVPDARLEQPTDAVVRITTTNICGSDLHNAALRDLITAGKATPGFLVSHELPLDQAPEVYAHFDKREDGWTKVVLHPHG